jgi:hypothetical protein
MLGLDADHESKSLLDTEHGFLGIETNVKLKCGGLRIKGRDELWPRSADDKEAHIPCMT